MSIKHRAMYNPLLNPPIILRNWLQIVPKRLTTQISQQREGSFHLVPGETQLLRATPEPQSSTVGEGLSMAPGKIKSKSSKSFLKTPASIWVLGAGWPSKLALEGVRGTPQNSPWGWGRGRRLEYGVENLLQAVLRLHK